jgi:hypothetical protein
MVRPFVAERIRLTACKIVGDEFPFQREPRSYPKPELPLSGMVDEQPGEVKSHTQVALISNNERPRWANPCRLAATSCGDAWRREEADKLMKLVDQGFGWEMVSKSLVLYQRKSWEDIPCIRHYSNIEIKV